MSPPTKKPSLPAGPLAVAYESLLTLYAPTRRHREVGKALERIFRSAGTAGGHQGLAIIGPTGSGKTASVLHAQRWLRTEMSLDASAPDPLPIVLMKTRSSGKSLANNILRAAGEPVGSTRSQDDAEDLIKASASDMHVVGIAIDEFHHSFANKTEKIAKSMTMSVKTVVNSLSKPIILMGIDGLEDYIDADKELRQRFESKVYLDDPRVTSKDDIEDMRLLLKMMKAVLPSEQDCDLDTPDMLRRLLVAAQCRFGSVVNRVRTACQFGAMEGRLAVNLDNFAAAYRVSAPRNKRRDEDNPFLQPIDKVNLQMKQIQDDKDRSRGQV